MKIRKAFLLLSRGKQIALVVCGLHLFAVVSLLGHHLISSRLRPPRPMVVKTILSAPPRPAPVIQAAPQPKKPTETKPKPTPPAPKPAPKPAAPPAVKKALPKLEPDPVLKEMAESFHAFKSEAQKPTPKKALTLPSKIQKKAPTIQSETDSTVDPTYSEFLIAYLQTALDLPEYGEVKAKLEIDRYGKLIHLQILEAKSSKNAEFLKTELPLLDFPNGDSNQSFTITFRNL